MKSITYTQTLREGDLRQRVSRLLASKTGDWRLFSKAGILLGLYLGLYALPFFVTFQSQLLILSFVLAGICMAGVGMAVMHDAAHGSFSKKKRVNNIMAHSLYLLGGYLPNWKMQHNVIHHSYTNVHDHDDDLDTGGLLRFSPHQKWKWYHRYQAFYAPFLYAIMTLLWATSKDFVQALRYKKEKVEEFQNIKKHLFWISVSKVLYFMFWLVIPLLFWKASWGTIVWAFFAMHLTAGLVLALVFQPAHVSSLTFFAEEPVFASRTEQQIVTSANFGMKSCFLTWLSGGLNYQTEHHLFPSISHIHYSKISSIIKSFCRERGLPYNNLGSFWQAVWNHFGYLHQLGRG